MKSELKYTPQNLDEVIYPSLAVERRVKAYATGMLEGHVFLYGPNGTGKSTIARLLVDAIGSGCGQIDTFSNEELVEKNDLREYLLRCGAMAKLTVAGKHFLVLDEFDYVRKGTDKLWRALDACSDGVMAIITTNNPNDIKPAIRSRFDLIEMPAISAQAALPRVQFILRAEGIVLPDLQVYSYLQKKETLMDWRKYLKAADELVFLRNSGLPFPSWTRPQSHKLKLV